MNTAENPKLTITRVRRSFFSEFKHPLDKVERVWLRRTFVILNLILIIPLGALAGVFEITERWFKKCW